MRWAALLLTAAPSLASAQWHLPLDVRNHRSVSLAFLRLAPRSHIAEPIESVLSYSLVGANELRRTGLVDEDAETWRLAVNYGYGLKEGTELFVELPVSARGAGIMDAIIEWWHAAVISHPNPVRESTPKGRSVIDNPSGGPFHSAIGIGDLTIGLAQRLAPGTLARIAVKLPTGDASNLQGSGGSDAAVALDHRFALDKRWTLDLNGGVTLQGTATHLSGTQRAVYSSAISLTFVQSTKDAWTVQWNSEQFPTKTGSTTLDKDHRVLTFGYQRLLKDGSVLQVYFSEDGDFLHFPGGPTLGPDYTVGVRLQVRR